MRGVWDGHSLISCLQLPLDYATYTRMEILNYAANILHYAVSFFVIISIIVFVHEFGHFFVARRCGVKIDEFSIGFGKEIFGWNDKKGTRWKIAVLPFGGFVKMHGDASEASNPDVAALADMSEAEKKISFHYKKLWQKALVVLAGPGANFLFSIFIFAFVFMVYGKIQLDSPVVNTLVKGGAAEKIGMAPGDVVTELDGKAITKFTQIPEAIKASTKPVLDITYKRGDKVIHDKIAPEVVEDKDAAGKTVKIGRIGIGNMLIGVDKNASRLNPLEAISEAVSQVYGQAAGMLEGIWQMIVGTRSSKELAGPVGIVNYAGQVTMKLTGAVACEFSSTGTGCGEMAREGVLISLLFMTLISTSLGLINLFPIPVLDGGHLLFYSYEAIMRRPLPEKAQSWAFKLGLAYVAFRLIYATYNDIGRMLG